MNLYIIGYKGWIGQKYINECIKEWIPYIYSDYRAESDKLLQNILDSKATHVISCIGRTHGTHNGVKYNTIDYLEHKDTLSINVNDNLFAPLKLALFCQKNGIHFTYIGTGCIFEYNRYHTLENDIGFTENDSPNFFGSNYSLIKGFTDGLMKQTNCLNLRIRMPITDEFNSRNFITKITNYEKICSIPNSMTVLTELIPISIEMMKNGETGTFNFTNPGSISHNEILVMYIDIVDNDFTWKNFTIEEQDKILLGKRSNNLLDTKKLESKYNVLPIRKSVEKVLYKMRENKDGELSY